MTQEQWAQQFESQRNTIVEGYAKTIQFTPEEQQALLTEPHTILPKLAGRLLFDAATHAYQGIVEQLPKLVPAIMAQVQAGNSLADRFYGQFPALDRTKPEVAQLVHRLGAQFYQMNPKASIEEQIKYVGATAHYMLGIPFPVPAAASPAPVAPAAAPPAPRSFVPAAPGVSAPQAPAGNRGPFDDVLFHDSV